MGNINRITPKIRPLKPSLYDESKGTRSGQPFPSIIQLACLDGWGSFGQLH